SLPKIPFVSNVTGDWITPVLATSPRYWSDHIRSTVKFSEGFLKAVVPGGLFLEVGPGDTLTRAAQAHLDRSEHHRAVSSLPVARTHALHRIDHALGTLWCNGVMPDWSTLYEGEERHRVPLPTYSFQRESYWIAPPRRGIGRPDVDAASTQSRARVSLYRPVWKRSPGSPDRKRNPASGACLVFSDGSPLASETEKQLSALGSVVVVVRGGERFERQDTNAFRINSARREDFVLLVEKLNERGFLPDRIVYFSSHGREGDAGASEVGRKNTALYGPLFLAQVLAEISVRAAAITIVTRNLLDVLGNETVGPEESLFLGPARVIPLEYKNLTCELVDVSDDCDHNHLALTAAELINGSAEHDARGVSAIRFGHRWRPAYEPVPAVQTVTCPFREDGVYLITGGLGALGLVTAEAIAGRVNATILLASRTALPARADWGDWLATHTGADAVSKRISAINRIEALGSTVDTVAADVSKERDVRELAETIGGRFGALHGIVHAAGSASGKTIHACTEIGRESILQTKVEGTRLLAEVFDLRALDFVAFYSSISSIAPVPGQVFYASANAFMDAFARALRADGVNAIAINWDAWKGAGMAQRFVDEHGDAFGVALENAIDPEEGADTLVRALTAQGPQLVACRGEVEDPGRYGPFVSATADRRSQSGASGPRPDLGVEFVAPGSTEENWLAALWEECLGISGIGVNDNFYDLGGHSLLFANLAEFLAERHAVAAPLSMFYECKTIAEQAIFIRDLPAGPPEDRMPAMTPLRGQTTTG
ncbi:MAG: SDR family NAD(P)-dependent oxidoreductase, partial [Candidatus Hydrogenedentota bacterium]